MSGVRVSVYAPNGTTLIAHVPRRKDVQWQDELNVPGTGQFAIHLDDPLLSDFPHLLDTYNIVKFSYRGSPIKAWQIEEVDQTYTSSGEMADRWVTVQGRGLLSVIESAVVYPEYGLNQSAEEDRQFNYASKDGIWRIPSQWVTPHGTPWSQDLSARKGYPKEWPDPQAEWIWSTNTAESAPVGRNWFRATFTTTVAQDFVIYAAADNEMSMRIDGVEVFVSKSWRDLQYIVKYLQPGTHTVAAWVDNYGLATPPSPVAGTTYSYKQTFTDYFARPDNQLIGNGWTQSGGGDFRIASGRAYSALRPAFLNRPFGRVACKVTVSVASIGGGSPTLYAWTTETAGSGGGYAIIYHANVTTGSDLFLFKNGVQVAAKRVMAEGKVIGSGFKKLSLEVLYNDKTGDIVVKGYFQDSLHFTFNDLIANAPTGTYIGAGNRATAGDIYIDNFLAGTYTEGSGVNLNANPAGLICSIFTADEEGQPIANVIRTNTTNWIVKPYGDPPGWYPATIIRVLIEEAQARNVRSVLPIAFDYDNVIDSNGQPWTLNPQNDPNIDYDVVDRTFKVGTSDLLDVLTQLVELGFDTDITPNFVMRAWKERGSDKSATVRLLPSRDITQSSASIQGSKIRNQLMLRSDFGWIEAANVNSQTSWGRREAGLTVGNAETLEQTSKVATSALQEVAHPDITIPLSFTSVAGPQPYVEFELGDKITVPDEEGLLQPARVMSITGSEQEGYVDWSLDLYPITQDDSISVTVPPGGTTGGGTDTVTTNPDNYQPRVLADGPWAYWRLKETKNAVLNDASQQAHSSTLAGTMPRYGVTGPVEHTGKAMLWVATNTSGYASTAPSFKSSTATVECFIRIESNPTEEAGIIGCATTPTGASFDKTLYIDSAGRVGFYVYNGAARVLAHATAIAKNVFHHVVGSVGPAGMKLYVNGTLVASDATVTTSYTGQFMEVCLRRCGAGFDFPLAMTIAEPAIYTKQLSDERVALHYAGRIGPTQTV